MQAVILAGGLGTRLGELTKDVPKSLVPVAGRPFVEHQLALLKAAGVERAVLCIAHHGQQIVDRLGDGSRWGLELAYSHEGVELLGTGGALKKAEPLLDEAFMMMWGDSYLLLDYAAIWRDFLAQPLPAMMVVYKNMNQRVPSNLVVGEGLVTVYDKWAEDPAKMYIDEGLTCMRRELLERVPADQPFAIEEIFRDLAGQHRLAAWETAQPFYEIGSPVGLAELEGLLAKSGEGESA